MPYSIWNSNASRPTLCEVTCSSAASIIFGSTAGKLYSVNAANGTLNEWFGENGVITLKTPEVMQTGVNAAY